MKIINVHQRELPVTTQQVGRLLDTLSQKDDLLWPWLLWPRMKFDQELGVSAHGGHGPIRYFVEEYVPGKRVRFRFTGPKGFDGFHGFDIVEVDSNRTQLRATLEMRVCGRAMISWPLLYRPLHDALIEDSFSFAEWQLNLEPQISKWSWWVRFLRWLVSTGKSPPQST